MPRFTVRQVFFSIFATATGLSIFRLPGGDWIDIAVAISSCYFVVSLGRHAAATRRQLNEHPDMLRLQYSAGWIFIGELSGIAVGLIVALVFRYLVAAGLLLRPSEQLGGLEHYSQFLPSDLAVLAMLASIGLTARPGPRVKPGTLRRKVYSLLAAAIGLIAILVYTKYCTSAYPPVYMSLADWEAANPSTWLPLGMNANAIVRIRHYVIGSFVGLPLVIAGLVLIATLPKWWHKHHVRWILVIGLAVAFADQCLIVRWIGGEGLRQLSPPFYDAIQKPNIAASIVVVLMVLLAAGAFCWRTLSIPGRDDPSRTVREQELFFHESWIGAMCVGIVATVSLPYLAMGDIHRAFEPIKEILFLITIDWQIIVGMVISRPTIFIWLAAAVGGLSLACVRWRQSKEPTREILPYIDPSLFGAMMIALSIAIMLGAPILAAASVSYWFVHLGMAF